LARAQRNHIGVAIRAFVRTEKNRIFTGIMRNAVRAYLANPSFTLGATA
jgi:chromosome condensin MukBEF complex kleisin-like MukF subunit